MTTKRALLTALTATTLALAGCTTLEPGRPVAAPGASAPASTSAKPGTSGKPSASGRPSASNAALTEIDVCGRVPADLMPTLVPQVTGKQGKATCTQEPTELNKAGYPAQEGQFKVDGKVVMAIVMTVYQGVLDMQGYVEFQLDQNPGKLTAYDVMSLPGYSGRSNFEDLKFVMGAAAGVNGDMRTGQVLLEQQPDEMGMSATAFLLKMTIDD